MSLKEALKLLRLETGMTQDDLACKINKTCLTVNRWENGKGFPSRNNAKEILAVAERCGASDECVSYLHEVLMPETKRIAGAAALGFPDIDREFLFGIADSSMNAVYVVEAKTYKLLYANKAAEKSAVKYLSAIGKQAEEKILFKRKDMCCFGYFADRKAPCPFCPLKEFEAGKVLDETITIPDNGHTMKIHAKSSKMKGRDVYVIYLTDITESTAEREALYELTNDIPAGVGIYNVYLDETIELVFMNTFYFQMIGEERQEALLRNQLSGFCLIHPDYKEPLMNEIREAIHCKRNIEINMLMRVIDRKYHMVHLNGRMIKKDQEKFTFYCLFTEIGSEDSESR